MLSLSGFTRETVAGGSAHSITGARCARVGGRAGRDGRGPYSDVGDTIAVVADKVEGMVGRVFVSMIRVYQRFVSPLFPPSCRFTPNCSRYTIQAIQKHGPLRGGAMGAWRILRCNPFSKGGYDPVE